MVHVLTLLFDLEILPIECPHKHHFVVSFKTYSGGSPHQNNWPYVTHPIHVPTPLVPPPANSVKILDLVLLEPFPLHVLGATRFLKKCTCIEGKWQVLSSIHNLYLYGWRYVDDICTAKRDRYVNVGIYTLVFLSLRKIPCGTGSSAFIWALAVAVYWEWELEGIYFVWVH